MPETQVTQRGLLGCRQSGFFGCLIPVILFTAGLSLSGCTDLSDYDRARVSDAIADSLLSVTESRDIIMDIMEDGIRRVTVESPRAATFERDGRTETLLSDSVRVSIRDTLDQVETVVTSRSARYYGRESEFHFKEGVVVQTRDGRSLFTDYLEWSQQQRSIYSPDFVIIVTARDSITGYGLKGTDDLVTYRMQEVTGEFELEQTE